MENYKKVELKSLETYKDKNNLGVESWCARAVYECENKYGKSEIIIPKIDLLIDPNLLPNIRSEYHETPFVEYPSWYIDIFGSEKPLLPDKKGNIYYEKVIEEYPQKMTLAEIEKKLGYKIELVSKK